MTEILNFAGEHYTLAWFALMVIFGVFYLAIEGSLRTVMVLCRGWPPAHLDASGDMADRSDADGPV